MPSRVLAGLFLLCSNLAAADPVVGESPPASRARFDALVDTYYLLNLSGGSAGTAPGMRVFDDRANSFTLNYAKVGMEVSEQGSGLRLDAGVGQAAYVLNTHLSRASAASGGTQYAGALFIQQAYGFITAGTWRLEVGRYEGHASDEYIETSKNWNHSRSLLFGMVPTQHTGVRVAKGWDSGLSVQVSVQNGFDNDPDTNTPKTIGLLATYAPREGRSFSLGGYYGNEQARGVPGPDEATVLVDAQTQHAFGDRVGLMVNALFLRDGTRVDSRVLGGGAKLLLKATPWLHLIPRGEFVQARNAVATSTDGTIDLYEGTLTALFLANANVQIRVEARYDGSDRAVFPSTDGLSHGRATLLVGLLGYL